MENNNENFSPQDEETNEGTWGANHTPDENEDDSSYTEDEVPYADGADSTLEEELGTGGDDDDESGYDLEDEDEDDLPDTEDGVA